METKKDISYGVVPVFKNGDDWQVLVIHQISYRGDSFWIFPKGHTEGLETPQQTALRELEEETGLTGVTLTKDQSISFEYSFIHEGVQIDKTVTYYVGQCANQSIHISQPHEIKELRWCTLPEAIKLLTHRNSRDVLSKVMQEFLPRS